MSSCIDRYPGGVVTKSGSAAPAIANSSVPNPGVSMSTSGTVTDPAIAMLTEGEGWKRWGLVTLKVKV
eukprot:2521383-Rhodomonas_salina.2